MSVGLAMDGRVVTLHRGQRLWVILAKNWTPPTARGASGEAGPGLQPLRSDSARGYPAPGRASAVFTATRIGGATVTAKTDYACRHVSPQCELPQRVFSLAVRVLPPAGQGAGPLPQPAHG
ncbi:MAG: hypothetical protein M3070_18165 [Actinomycetota bacterium]|nr:hypothetical protein [Actinomycetota bacterium]